jgi:hypothetical protein
MDSLGRVFQAERGRATNTKVPSRNDPGCLNSIRKPVKLERQKQRNSEGDYIRK